MAVPTQLSDLSAIAASNSPAGSDTVGTTMDDYIRAIQSIIVRISAGTDAMATPNIGAATGTSLVLSGLATVNGAFTSLGLDDNATATALTLSGSGANSVTIANSATNPTIGTSAGDLILAPGANTALVLANIASAANYLYVQPGVLANENVVLRPAGAATNCALVLSSKGSGGIALDTGTATLIQVLVQHTASADRYITLTGSNGGNPTIGTSAGGLVLAPGGTGEAAHVFIASNTGAATPVRVTTLGLAIGANYSTGPGEVDFYNSYYTATASFDFRQITASGVSASVARLIPISGGTAGLAFVQGSGTVNARIGTEAASNIVIGAGSALATTATTNHMMIPTCAGTPTGVPVGAGAGQLAMIYDTTNNFLYVYNGGWKKSTAYA